MLALGTTFVVLATAVLQVFAPAVPFLGGAKPPLLLGLVLYYALTRLTAPMLGVALVAGLLHDCFSPVRLGFSSLCFCGIGLSAGVFRTLVYADTPATPIVFGTLAALAFSVAFVMWHWAPLRLDLCTGWWLAWRLCGAAVLGGLVAPVMFVVARSMDHVALGLRQWGRA